MTIKTKWIEILYNVATGSRKVRNFFTPIGALFYALLILSFIVIALQVDRLLGMVDMVPKPLSIILALPVFSFALFLIGWSVLNFLRAKGTPVPFNPPPQLVTTGPYAYVRNPMLTGVFALLFGFGVLLGSVSILFVFTPLFICINVWELKAIEEPELVKRLGEDYIEYRKRTPMFFPGIGIILKKKLPIFTTPEDRAKYIAAYETMFVLWKVPHDSIDIKTSYGSTHINISGPGDGYPLVLLHGAGLTSTVWFANIAQISAHHRVYAVDVIGDAGKSVPDRLMEKRSDYAHWLKEVFDGLNIEKCDLLGHSYGGWLTLNMAVAYPNRLRKIVLLAPAASFRPLGFITKLMLYLGEFKIGPPARSMLQLVAAKGTVLEETFIDHIEMVTRYCRPASIYPTVYTDAELKQIDLPALLLIGAGEKIYNPQKVIKRAQRWMPDLTAEIIPDAGHLLVMDQPEIINARILKFLSNE